MSLQCFIPSASLLPSLFHFPLHLGPAPSCPPCSHKAPVFHLYPSPPTLQSTMDSFTFGGKYKLEEEIAMGGCGMSFSISIIPHMSVTICPLLPVFPPTIPGHPKLNDPLRLLKAPSSKVCIPSQAKKSPSSSSPLSVVLHVLLLSSKSPRSTRPSWVVPASPGSCIRDDKATTMSWSSIYSVPL